jgi:ATP-dependent Lon protease
MEIIEMSGYTEEEKLNIAKEYLLPKEIDKHGLKKDAVAFTDEALMKIIREYAKEAGVRNLERTAAKILRKIATRFVREKVDLSPEAQRAKGEKKVTVEEKDLETYLGAPRFRYGIAEEKDQIGTATGLVWTEVGGDTTPVEVTIMAGRGNLTLTGQLGDVMQESAKAAMSFIRTQAEDLGLDANFYRKFDIHIHVPEGAVPKDGPSAGITIATALASALCKIPIKRDLAMTGEITLRGKVLAIGGLKEKLLAARRAGISNVIIPDENKKDIDEIKKELPEDLKINFVKEAKEVLELALVYSPFEKPVKEKEERKRPYKYPYPTDGQLYA